MVYAYNEILLSLKKGGNSDKHYNMDEPWGHYMKWISCHKRQALSDSTYRRPQEQLDRETEVEWWLPGSMGRSFVWSFGHLMVIIVLMQPDGKMKKALKWAEHNTRIIIWMHLMLPTLGQLRPAAKPPPPPPPAKQFKWLIFCSILPQF